MSERVTLLLASSLGYERARETVAAAAARASGSGGSLRAELAGELPEGELDEVFDPTTYLGAAAELVDTALDHYRKDEGWVTTATGV
jgi:adenylosuccinate lyase